LAVPLVFSQAMASSVPVLVVALVSGLVVVPSLLLVSVVDAGHEIKAPVNPEATAELTKTSPPLTSFLAHAFAAEHSMTSPSTAALR